MLKFGYSCTGPVRKAHQEGKVGLWANPGCMSGLSKLENTYLNPFVCPKVDLKGERAFRQTIACEMLWKLPTADKIITSNPVIKCLIQSNYYDNVILNHDGSINGNQAFHNSNGWFK